MASLSQRIATAELSIRCWRAPDQREGHKHADRRLVREAPLAGSVSAIATSAALKPEVASSSLGSTSVSGPIRRRCRSHGGPDVRVGGRAPSLGPAGLDDDAALLRRASRRSGSRSITVAAGSVWGQAEGPAQSQQPGRLGLHFNTRDSLLDSPEHILLAADHAFALGHG